MSDREDLRGIALRRSIPGVGTGPEVPRVTVVLKDVSASAKLAGPKGVGMSRSRLDQLR